MELDNVTGKLIVADGAVRMTPLSLNAFGGAMVANGIYSTAESVVRPMVNFDLDIQKPPLKNVRAIGHDSEDCPHFC